MLTKRSGELIRRRATGWPLGFFFFRMPARWRGGWRVFRIRKKNRRRGGKRRAPSSTITSKARSHTCLLGTCGWEESNNPVCLEGMIYHQVGRRRRKPRFFLISFTSLHLNTRSCLEISLEGRNPIKSIQ